MIAVAGLAYGLRRFASIPWAEVRLGLVVGLARLDLALTPRIGSLPPVALNQVGARLVPG